MADIKRICLGTDCYSVPEADDFATKQELADGLADKQDTLTPGTNIDLTNNVVSAPNVYTKAEVNDLIDAIETGEIVIVQTLPATGENKTIYFVPKTGGGYTEWMYISGAWEEIGDTDIDLSGYYTKTETDAAFLKKNELCGSLTGCNVITGIQGDIQTLDADFLHLDNRVNTLETDKQDALTPGTNIDITNNVVSAPDVYTKAEIDALLATKQDVIGTYFILAGAGSNMFEVAAGATSTQAITLSIPAGFTFVGYRQVSIGNGSDGYGAADCLIRFISSTGGGTQAQVSIKNIGSSRARVSIGVTALLLKTI